MKKMGRPIPVINGLYAITPDSSDTSDLLRRSTWALEGGASVLQYRNKSASEALRQTQALALRELTRQFSIPLIINDDALLAAKVNADGVHLGEFDGELHAARAILGEGKFIGVSCYNCAASAKRAVTAGANYVAFGAFYSSSIKPDAVTAELGLLREMRRELGVPIVAIGGITAQNGAPLVQAGAAALAVISALFDAPDIKMAAAEFTELFKQSTT
jgi:thiamine-phosphate pyrophosphorylase